MGNISCLLCNQPIKLNIELGYKVYRCGNCLLGMGGVTTNINYLKSKFKIWFKEESFEFNEIYIVFDNYLLLNYNKDITTIIIYSINKDTCSYNELYYSNSYQMEYRHDYQYLYQITSTIAAFA